MFAACCSCLLPPPNVTGCLKTIANFHFLKWPFPLLQEWNIQCRQPNDNFNRLNYPLLIGKMASKTNFGQSKMVFSPSYMKKCFSQIPAVDRFQNFVQISKAPPWDILSWHCLQAHVPPTSTLDCRGFNHQHLSAERWDLEFGYQTSKKNIFHIK